MEKGKKLSEADTDEYVAEKVAEVGGLAASDTNVDVAGLGALAVTASGTYNGSRTADGLAQIAATTATDLKNKKERGKLYFNNNFKIFLWIFWGLLKIFMRKKKLRGVFI